MVGDVKALHALAMTMRKQRYENGALSLDNLKLRFALDDDGNPASAEPEGTFIF